MEEQLLEKILKILEDKKAEDIKVIDIKEKTSIADYFIIASGTSNTHVKSLSDNIEKELKKEQIYAEKIEGYTTGTWVLMNYGGVVVHIFTPDERQNYDLETLWNKTVENLEDNVPE